MKTLVAIEWLKIRKYRTFWILVSLFLILLPLWNFSANYGLVNAQVEGIDLMTRAYKFPQVWSNVGFWAGVFVMLLSILIIILTCNEYSYRTNRQNIIDGWSRLDFFHAKIGLIALISLAATAYVFLVTAALGWVNSGAASGMIEESHHALYFLLLCLNYLGFALILGLWIRRSGLAIGLFLLYNLILEPIFSSVLNWKLNFKPGHFLPLQSTDNLLPLPFMRDMTDVLKLTTHPDWAYILAGLLWLLVYYFIGRRMLLRRDW